MNFVVYSKDNCPFCEQAKQLITQKGDTYSENKLGVDFDRDQLFELFPDARTFPIVLEMAGSGAERIGGFQDLVKYYNNKSIEGMTL